MGHLGAVKGYLLDMDGVLYRGNTVRPGAREWIAYLHEHDIPYLCVTNNATRTAAEYEAKLAQLGIPIPAERILGSAETTAAWLQRQAPESTVYAIGTEGLHSELRRHGLHVLDNTRPEEVNVVVVGLDPTLTYEKLKIATLAINTGATFIGTNPDATYPSEEGLAPGCGAILAAVERATGQRPIIIGKPEPIIFREALHRLGLQPEEVAMVGDRLDTDIEGGHRMGMTTILILGGVTSEEELEITPILPDYVFADLGELLRAVQEGRA
nr:HAD-IIA family hydrolase [Ardenticatena sp.]